MTDRHDMSRVLQGQDFSLLYNDWMINAERLRQRDTTLLRGFSLHTGERRERWRRRYGRGGCVRVCLRDGDMEIEGKMWRRKRKIMYVNSLMLRKGSCLVWLLYILPGFVSDPVPLLDCAEKHCRNPGKHVETFSHKVIQTRWGWCVLHFPEGRREKYDR